MSGVGDITIVEEEEDDDTVPVTRYGPAVVHYAAPPPPVPLHPSKPLYFDGEALNPIVDRDFEHEGRVERQEQKAKDEEAADNSIVEIFGLRAITDARQGQ